MIELSFSSVFCWLKQWVQQPQWSEEDFCWCWVGCPAWIWCHEHVEQASQGQSGGEVTKLHKLHPLPKPLTLTVASCYVQQHQSQVRQPRASWFRPALRHSCLEEMRLRESVVLDKTWWKEDLSWGFASFPKTGSRPSRDNIKDKSQAAHPFLPANWHIFKKIHNSWQSHGQHLLQHMILHSNVQKKLQHV